ncbi:uncharacterized protein K444DRAFT_606407 [Hyaloscypha bicolor E]|uniref:Uncharacterized protein n=1 Tax=Hyaloscypha bicolor E TaxID=1095630 RepID=A0A2J6TWY7_9HELO|nr:uncharacterized protein K444DRAFT_606407 [Hyaloscypha bicolor E]PMD67468.1 hypothetical protein K444DRAFT_606407 [Hyaloscypha bicolor E]
MAVPTSLAPSTSTCHFVSIPATTSTIVYTSGEVGLFPQTTYTALTTSFITLSSDLVVECDPLYPGETSVSIADLGQTCSSTWLPATTEYITYTSGQLNVFFLTTYTAASTGTIVSEPTNFVTCQPLPDYQNQATCHGISPLTWTSLVITFVSVQLTWWIFELPLLWKENAGWMTFFDAVSWACVRSHSPGSAAAIAVMKGSDASEFARIYYLGLRRKTAPDEWIKWKLYTSIGVDLMSITATVITIYQACTLPQYDPRRHFGLSLWVYPTLPVALIGLCLLAGEKLAPRTHHASRRLFAFTISILGLTATAVSLVLWKFATTDENGTWWISLVFYVLMILPLLFLANLLPGFLYEILWPAWSKVGWFFWCVAAWVVRVGGVSIAALDHYSGGEPYCKFAGPGFAIVYMILGGLAAVLAWGGIFYHAGPYLGQPKIASRGVQGS